MIALLERNYKAVVEYACLRMNNPVGALKMPTPPFLTQFQDILELQIKVLHFDYRKIYRETSWYVKDFLFLRILL